MQGLMVVGFIVEELFIVTELWRLQECLEKNQRGITWKLRKWEKLF